MEQTLKPELSLHFYVSLRNLYIQTISVALTLTQTLARHQTAPKWVVLLSSLLFRRSPGVLSRRTCLGPDVLNYVPDLALWPEGDRDGEQTQAKGLGWTRIPMDSQGLTVRRSNPRSSPSLFVGRIGGFVDVNEYSCHWDKHLLLCLR